jgi:predicted ATPase/DNA-binding SARP family transcriptional activator
VRIALLGPLDVTDGHGQTIPIAGARLRALLIRLALDSGRTVGVDALTDAIWDGDAPAGATNALQTLVSRLRRSLPAGAIAADQTGYRVTAALDIDEFDAYVRDGRAAAGRGDLVEARRRYDAAVILWRGAPLSDVANADFARAPIARLAEAQIAAIEERLAVRLSLDDAGSIVAELDALAAAHPLRERPHQLLITALAGSGRSADAVAVYIRLRDRLADELGLDPSAELTATYAAMLRGERPPLGPGVTSLAPALPAPILTRPASLGRGSPPANDAASPDGAADKARVSPMGNLRSAVTSFVGRAAEVADLVATVREHRLVTLVGPGGAGKTRLAVEAGRVIGAEFPDGVWLVELAPIGEATDVPRALTEALSLRETRMAEDRRADPLRALDQIEAANLLVILDNCEHLIDACAHIAEEVLSRCPAVRILATSREPLAIAGEVLRPLGPLSTPPLGATPAAIADTASVRLFADRAAAVRPGFAVNEGTDATTADAVAEICRRLDGMPLAIELAGARLRTVPVEQIAARLDDRFRLLTSGSRTALPRHQTLVAAVAWSWDLLEPAERDLAMRFAVFAGGATMDAVVEVWGTDSVERLLGLVDKSFVVLGDDGRYRMLETIRAYAAERLADSGHTDAARDVHAAYFVRVAEDADAHLRGRGQARSLRTFGAERDNLSTALRWTIDSGEAALAARLAGALGWFWMMSDYHVEAAARLGEAIALPGDVPPLVRAKALALYGMNLAVIGTPDDAVEFIAEAQLLAPDDPTVVLGRVLNGVLPVGREEALKHLPLALDHPDPWVRAMGLTVRGITHMYAAAPNDAERDLTEGLAAFEDLGDNWARAMLGGALGELRAIRGDTDGAVTALQRSAALADSLGVDDVAAQSILQLSLVRARRGDLDGARVEVRRARAKIDRLVSPVLGVSLAVAEAEIARRAGDLTLARERYHEGLDPISDVRSVPRETYAGLLAGLMVTEVQLGDAAAVRRTGARLMAHTVREHIVVVMAAMALAFAIVEVDSARAAHLLGVADAMRGIAELGNPDVARVATAARERLGDEAYDAALADGRTVDGVDAAIDALREAATILDIPVEA